MILYKKSLQSNFMLVTLNLNSIIGSKFLSKNYFHTTVKVNETENENENNNHNNNKNSQSNNEPKENEKIEKTAKQKLREKLAKFKFVPIDNKIHTIQTSATESINKLSTAMYLKEKIDENRIEKQTENVEIEFRLAKLINKNDIGKATEELNYPLNKYENQSSSNQSPELTGELK